MSLSYESRNDRIEAYTEFKRRCDKGFYYIDIGIKIEIISNFGISLMKIEILILFNKKSKMTF